jgi:hypothetical protein
MIHVTPAPEPASFDRKVRRPGLSAIAELVGEPLTVRRSGPRRKKIAERREDIPAACFPTYWTEALQDLLAAYHRVCAYVCVYIERVTGASSVDHMIPKSSSWDKVYEWSNYRLVCSLMNSRKLEAQDALDPFEVQHGWFELDLTGFQVRPADDLNQATRQRVLDTIHRLKLNDADCRGLREEYATNYWERHIDLDYLSKRAPFVAMELRRQGKLRDGDA